ncbi:MAG: hypothetical protein H6562_24435 [Lewinellaceae bacterium]|nr:hypothetical protein [Lewinella sp.]MCB9282060.1 hypothetical protein [Lewinellaceae bacterium]
MEEAKTRLEDWELEFAWLRVRHLVRDIFRREDLPDLNAVLFLIGIQELGKTPGPFSKEEKQDLMHIAVCRLLSDDGYFRFSGRDADGWPHWEPLKPFTVQGVKHQERLLQEQVIRYFGEMDEELAPYLDRFKTN